MSGSTYDASFGGGVLGLTTLAAERVQSLKLEEHVIFKIE